MNHRFTRTAEMDTSAATPPHVSHPAHQEHEVPLYQENTSPGDHTHDDRLDTDFLRSSQYLQTNASDEMLCRIESSNEWASGVHTDTLELEDVVSDVESQVPSFPGKPEGIIDGGHSQRKRDKPQHSSPELTQHDPASGNSNLVLPFKKRQLTFTNVETEPSAANIFNAQFRGQDIGETNQSTYIDFEFIRLICETDIPGTHMYTHPEYLAQHRREDWPYLTLNYYYNEYIPIYEAVRRTGLPNALSAKNVLPSILNLMAWECRLKNVPDGLDLYHCIAYGFPMGYLGPICNTLGVEYHLYVPHSIDEIGDIMKRGVDQGGILGPFANPPFQPWLHISYIKSSEESDLSKCDLRFPLGSSINAYIKKNDVMGVKYFCLDPYLRYDLFVADLISIGPGACLASISIPHMSRYFRSDPLDWPLNALNWQDEIYVDTTMFLPNRSRDCSLQRVADAIVAMLRSMGIQCHMQLNDLVIIASSLNTARLKVHTAKSLLEELGFLDVTPQPPSPGISWSGLYIHAPSMSVLIDRERLMDIRKHLSRAFARSIGSKEDFQSLISKLQWISRVIEPARTIIVRLEEACKCKGLIQLGTDHDFRADIVWFYNFANEWEGVTTLYSLYEVSDIDIVVNATGIISATDGTYVYTYQVGSIHDTASNISELEAANVVVALTTLVPKHKRGTQITVHCNNATVVQALSASYSTNPVIMDCTRKAMYIQALYQVNISYVQDPGVWNDVMTVLNKAHIDSRYAERADHIVRQYSLSRLEPHTHVYKMISPPVRSKSGGLIVAVPNRYHPTQPYNDNSQGKTHPVPQPDVHPHGTPSSIHQGSSEQSQPHILAGSVPVTVPDIPQQGRPSVGPAGIGVSKQRRVVPYAGASRGSGPHRQTDHLMQGPPCNDTDVQPTEPLHPDGGARSSVTTNNVHQRRLQPTRQTEGCSSGAIQVHDERTINEVVQAAPGKKTNQIWEKGHKYAYQLVSEEYKELITKKMPKLGELPIARMWPTLRKYKVVDFKAEARTKSKGAPPEQMHELLDILQQGPMWKLHAFFRCLQQTGQKHILTSVLKIDSAIYEAESEDSS